MFKWFKKEAPKKLKMDVTIDSYWQELLLLMRNNFQAINSKLLKKDNELQEILTLIKDSYHFNTIMAALDAIQTRMNNIECRIMDLDTTPDSPIYDEHYVTQGELDRLKNQSKRKNKGKE